MELDVYISQRKMFSHSHMDGNKVECGQISDDRKNSCKRGNTIMRVLKERKTSVLRMLTKYA